MRTCDGRSAGHDRGWENMHLENKINYSWMGKLGISGLSIVFFALVDGEVASR